MLGHLAREQVSDFLSGLLIGAEVASMSESFAAQQAITRRWTRADLTLPTGV